MMTIIIIIDTIILLSGLASIRRVSAVEDSLGTTTRNYSHNSASNSSPHSHSLLGRRRHRDRDRQNDTTSNNNNSNRGSGSGRESGAGSGSGSRQKRLRSRNIVVDAWLGDEDGTDTYADLEDFLVE